jgi:hypothetical protein
MLIELEPSLGVFARVRLVYTLTSKKRLVGQCITQVPKISFRKFVLVVPIEESLYILPTASLCLEI